MFLVGCASNSEFSGLKRNVIAMGDAQQSQAIATEMVFSRLSVEESVQKVRITEMERRIFALEDQVSKLSSRFDTKFRTNLMK